MNLSGADMATMFDEPLNVGQANYNPLFRYGYGLRTRPTG